MKTPQQQLCDRVREILPRLMKINLGCLVSLEAYGDRPQVHTVYKANFPQWNDVVPYEIETCCGTWTPTSLNDGKWKHEMQLGGWNTIGHPPQLHDVLEAVYSTMCEMTSIDGAKQEAVLSMLEYYVTPEGDIVEPMWNLSLPASEQSDETCLFLLDILK